MNETGEPERRRFQFGVRKVLLWTAVVALGLGVLSPLEGNDLGLVLLPVWFATVCIVRWGYGSVRAATASVTAGILIGLLSCLSSVVTYSTRAVFAPLALTMIGGLLGASFGLIVFVLAEFASRAVNWLDGIGRSDG